MSDAYIANSATLDQLATDLEKECTNYNTAQEKLVSCMKEPAFTGAGGDAWETVTHTAETELPKFTEDLTALVALIKDSALKNTEFDEAVAAELNGLF